MGILIGERSTMALLLVTIGLSIFSAAFAQRMQAPMDNIQAMTGEVAKLNEYIQAGKANLQGEEALQADISRIIENFKQEIGQHQSDKASLDTTLKNVQTQLQSALAHISELEGQLKMCTTENHSLRKSKEKALHALGLDDEDLVKPVSNASTTVE